MWPIIPLAAKAAAKFGGVMLLEVGAKKVLEKITGPTVKSDRINTQHAKCGGFYMEGELSDQHDGLAVCNNCGHKVARYQVNKAGK